MQLPKWHQEIERFLSFRTTFTIEGNIHDLHSYPTNTEKGVRWDMVHLDRYLFSLLKDQGYETIVYYNHIDGFTNDIDAEHLTRFLDLIGEKNNLSERNSYKATLDKASNLIRASLENRTSATAVVMNLASRYVTSPNNLTEEESQFYSRLFMSTLKPTQVRSESKILQNLLFIIPNKTNDIPVWFFLNNPYVKNIELPNPDKETRQRFIDSQIRFFEGAGELTEAELEKYKQEFVDLTEGFKNIELNGLRKLCSQERIPLRRMTDAVSLFKYGIRENPWGEIDEALLENAEESIRKRVKGQNAAVTQSLDIIKRAASGLSGLQHSSGSSKPKGILFFAGPTGTGKTELAKTLSSLLFADEKACIRFDMSEYQQSHSDQKLLGAPPGYVGYEAGGQLTNAVKEKPFSILLFDEIEKAHPSILDKFLQILEDGRMTDGQGETVHFSESIIIFTSNLGIYKKDQFNQRTLNVSYDMGYSEIQEKVIEAIKEYFTIELGRPEILNRFGNNFVVFDFIREEVAKSIFHSQIDKITDALSENRSMQIEIDDSVLEFIEQKALSNLENGGRGIGNIIEKYFINPLSRFLFDRKVKESSHVSILHIEENENVVQLDGKVV
ncbi:AAA family ATPase [Evansella sp. LMS18]|uniref:AAA family ATPase n=1 Tax=Evansella sp. LMS18 TaxID=2924033 RepID=UPI0020D01EC8|nr:AAA family ATPase [Evansella sp. LMS18]UTR12095.1 AAA family ATPase [Evansella sp. LMS18]